MSEFRLIDIEYLKRISGNDMDFCREILEMFIRQTTSDVADLERYYQKGLWEDLRHRSHAMRSTMSSLQVKDLNRMLRTLEEESRSTGDPGQIESVLKEVISSSDQAITEARRILEDI